MFKVRRLIEGKALDNRTYRRCGARGCAPAGAGGVSYVIGLLRFHADVHGGHRNRLRKRLELVRRYRQRHATQVRPSFSDVNGNFVKDINYIDTNGTFSNSVTGGSLVYKSRSIEHDCVAIPGDSDSTFTAITTGEMQIIAPGGRVVWQNAGRVVDIFSPNGEESLTWEGPHDDLVNGFLGQTDISSRLCAALGA
jgi:hypothetical protein